MNKNGRAGSVMSNRERQMSMLNHSWLQQHPTWLFNQEYSGVFEPLPNHLGARLMFYLHCVYRVLDIRDADSIEDLIDYEHHIKLSSQDIDKLIILAIALSPDRLANRCFFENDEKCGVLINEFYHKHELSNEIKIPDFVQIGVDQRSVYNIMCFKHQFLQDNYYSPLNFYKTRIRQISEAISMCRSKNDTFKSRQKNDDINACFCSIL